MTHPLKAVRRICDWLYIQLLHIPFILMTFKKMNIEKHWVAEIIVLSMFPRQILNSGNKQRGKWCWTLFKGRVIYLVIWYVIFVLTWFIKAPSSQPRKNPVQGSTSIHAGVSPGFRCGRWSMMTGHGRVDDLSWLIGLKQWDLNIGSRNEKSGNTWCGVVWCGVVWCGVWCVVWPDVVFRDPWNKYDYHSRYTKLITILVRPD